MLRSSAAALPPAPASMAATTIALFNAIAPRSAGSQCRTPCRQPLPALAAEARATCALRYRVAGALVGQGARADVPRRTQRRPLAENQLPRGVRRGAAHRP